MKRPNDTFYEESAAYLRGRIAERFDSMPVLAVILGSGLGDYVDSDAMTEKLVIPYKEIPGFPVSTVSYQKGELIVGRIGDHTVLFFNGRFHYYEGWEMWQTAYPVAVCYMLGVRRMIITNAAGGINPDRVAPGDLVCVTDHIKLCADSPVRGENSARLGERFFDMQSVYDAAYIEMAKACAQRIGFVLKEGVYCYMSGPQFETPAEIRMLKLLGGDLVGMSTVAEVIEAAHCGIRVLCISCVTNLAAGVTGLPMTEKEVLETSASIKDRFEQLLDGVIEGILSESADR